MIKKNPKNPLKDIQSIETLKNKNIEYLEMLYTYK